MADRVGVTNANWIGNDHTEFRRVAVARGMLIAGAMKLLVAATLLAVGCGSNPAATDCVDEDGDGVTQCDGDCDDTDALSSPGENEVCGDDVDNNCDGTPDEGCNGLGTFVSSLTGDDANPGTKALPVATIAKGMSNAMTIGGSQSVLVAEGMYSEKVTLVEGIDLLGGFSCTTADCSWLRDPLAYDSKIVNTDFEGVVAGLGITVLTLVEGFSIQGLGGVPGNGGSSGVLIASGSPKLRANRITGGTVTGGGFTQDRSVAVRLTETDATGAILDHNELTGGTSIGLSAGVLFDAYPARTTAVAAVLGNTIRGGAGQRSIGLLAWNSGAGTLVQGNDIIAGNSTNGASHGIEVGSTMTIDGNRINVDQATVGACMGAQRWCAGIASESSTTIITNNIVFPPKAARSAAVFLGEFEVAAGVVVVNGNTLNGGGIGPLTGNISQSAAVVVSIGTCMMCGTNGAIGRIRNNILDGGINAARFGVREDPAAGRTMRAEALENNVFWFSSAASRTDILYRQVAGNGTPTDVVAIAALNMMTAPAAVSNQHVDPMLDATWHLVAGSPCIDTGSATEAPTTDFEGEARPAGGATDIGHDEMP
jgi:Putative metal-binding motif